MERQALSPGRWHRVIRLEEGVAHRILVGARVVRHGGNQSHPSLISPAVLDVVPSRQFEQERAHRLVVLRLRVGNLETA
eukprot:scaffold995_cov244-Pinguiococcus_pyrenoidosus.AAC.10